VPYKFSFNIHNTDEIMLL